MEKNYKSKIIAEKSQTIISYMTVSEVNKFEFFIISSTHHCLENNLDLIKYFNNFSGIQGDLFLIIKRRFEEIFGFKLDDYKKNISRIEKLRKLGGKETKTTWELEHVFLPEFNLFLTKDKKLLTKEELHDFSKKTFFQINPSKGKINDILDLKIDIDSDEPKQINIEGKFDLINKNVKFFNNQFEFGTEIYQKIMDNLEKNSLLIIKSLFLELSNFENKLSDLTEEDKYASEIWDIDDEQTMIEDENRKYRLYLNNNFYFESLKVINGLLFRNKEKISFNDFRPKMFSAYGFDIENEIIAHLELETGILEELILKGENIDWILENETFMKNEDIIKAFFKTETFLADPLKYKKDAFFTVEIFTSEDLFEDLFKTQVLNLYKIYTFFKLKAKDNLNFAKIIKKIKLENENFEEILKKTEITWINKNSQEE